ncbi:MAG TPA: site-2 protease family protein [Candidatus Limnocylindrales bacterium]|nr:site-2 protease family protein [Candidatus Limnocylindrales bacterium]
MFDFTPERLAAAAFLIAFFLLVGFPVHEFAHALAADRLGDHTARFMGRLTLNPIRHFDPLGGILLAVSILLSPFVFGWAKPTPVNPSNLVDRRNGELVVALAGPASNLVMASVMALVFRAVVGLEVDVPNIVVLILFNFVFFNVMLAVFNLIPVPPLDGSQVLFRFLPPSTAWRLRTQLAQYGFVIIIVGVLLFGGAIAGFMLDVTVFLVGL